MVQYVAVVMFITLFILLSLLFVTIRINVYPELFYFPWLVSIGRIPYKDFFDHHGFLLYYILAPLTGNGSVKYIYAAFFISYIAFFVLVYKSLKMHATKDHLFIGSVIFIFLSLYLMGGNMWFDLYVAILYVLAYILLNTNIGKKYHLVGICIALASMIKPTYAIILLPLTILTGSFSLLISFVVSWLLPLVYYYLNGALYLLYENLVVFNRFYASYMIERKIFSMDPAFLIILCMVLEITLICSIIYRNYLKRDNLFIYAFFFSGLIGLMPRFEYINLLPSLPFFIILIVRDNFFKKQLRCGIIRSAATLLLAVYSIFIFLSIYGWLKTRTVYTQTNNICSVSILKNQIKNDGSFYILSNNPEMYYFADNRINVHYPIVLPWYKEYFGQKLGSAIVSDLLRNNPDIVLRTSPDDPYFSDIAEIEKYVNKHYTIIINRTPCKNLF